MQGPRKNGIRSAQRDEVHEIRIFY